MKRVEIGDILVVDGVSYKIGVSSAAVINIWVKIWNAAGQEVVSTNSVHLYRKEGVNGDLISAPKIKAALEKLEKLEK